MEIDAVKPGHMQMHQQWKDARARLRAPETIKEKPVEQRLNVIELVPQTTDPTRDLMDFIIAAVGNVAGLPVNEILAGLPTTEIRCARNLAMALCMRRLKLETSVVAEYFEVQPLAVKEAAFALDPILVRFSISNKTPIELLLPTIWGQWGKEVDTPTITEIQRAVCHQWIISKLDLVSMRRTSDLVLPRHAAIALSKRLTLHSLPEIGRLFGMRDHTTILHAVRKFAPVIEAVDTKLLPAASVVEWVETVFETLKTVKLARNKRYTPKLNEIS